MSCSTEEINGESWKDIPGFNGRYQASTLGRIKAVGHPRRTNHTFIMKPQPRGAGNYHGVGLLNPELGKTRSVYIHTLVALTFLGPKPEGMQINHRDLNKHNNAVSNLEYVTPSDNMRHLYTYSGGRQSGKGRVLSHEEVKAIREADPSLSNRALGAMYGTSHETVRQIRLGKRWDYLHDGSQILTDFQKRTANRNRVKMTPDLVRLIRQRALTEPRIVIAREYGYSNTNICDIVTRRRWNWVD